MQTAASRSRPPALHTLLKLFRELNHFPLRPPPVITRRLFPFTHKRTMSSALALDINNVGIRNEFLPRLRQNTNERIIRCVDHQRGTRDPVYDMRRCGTIIIIIGPGEPAIVGSHALIKLAQALDPSQAQCIKRLGKQPHLAPISPEQLQEKIIFINSISPLMQRIRSRRQIHRRTDRRYPPKFRRPVAAPLPSQFQHQVTAHGKPNQHEPSHSVALHNLARHRRHIPRTAGVIKRRRAMIHPTAVALVHPHYVHARRQSAPRDPQHVLRFARSLQPMHDDQRQRAAPLGLPVTVT